MSEPFASGDWRVTPGKEDEFVQRWTEFLTWSRENHPGLVGANLLRDGEDASHFLSFAEWSDADARESWRQAPGFMEHFKACRELCEEMRGADYERVVVI